jgi:hypothetical protein
MGLEHRQKDYQEKIKEIRGWGNILLEVNGIEQGALQ